jgi:hypothetical protein
MFERGDKLDKNIGILGTRYPELANFDEGKWGLSECNFQLLV